VTFPYAYNVSLLDFLHHHSPSSLFSRLKIISTSFMFYFHTSMWGTLTIFALLYLPIHPPIVVPTPIGSVLHLVLFKVCIYCSKGFHLWIYCTLINPTLSIILLYPFPLLPIIQQLSVHFVMPSSYTVVMYFDLVHYLSFSFHSFLPLVPSTSHYIHICVCVYIFVYIYLLNLSFTY
jgi:hypothetical protein